MNITDGTVKWAVRDIRDDAKRIDTNAQRISEAEAKIEQNITNIHNLTLEQATFAKKADMDFDFSKDGEQATGREWYGCRKLTFPSKIEEYKRILFTVWQRGSLSTDYKDAFESAFVIDPRFYIMIAKKFGKNNTEGKVNFPGMHFSEGCEYFIWFSLADEGKSLEVRRYIRGTTYDDEDHEYYAISKEEKNPPVEAMGYK